MQLNINTDEVVKFTNKLEKLHRSALPVAIRTALGDAAMNVKQKTMPKSFESHFVNRTHGSFFKANSRVIYPVGFNVNTMAAAVGFFENKLVNQSTNWAVKDLEQQEDGGTINVKTFIPTVFARRGGTKKGLIKPNFRLKKIRSKIINANTLQGKNERQKYVLAANKAGVGGFVLYKKILWQINSLKSSAKIERTPIYSVSKGRNIKVKNTKFMEKASIETMKNMTSFYIAAAKKQIDRLTK